MFFANCQRKYKASDREEEFEKIRAEYAKVVEDANEKVQIAEECYGLVDRYLRKLDEELLKFKCELEADNRGITEILEKQSLEMDAPSSSTSMAHQFSKENRLPKKHKKSNNSVGPSDFSMLTPSSSSIKMEYDPSFGTSSMASGFATLPTQPSTLPLQHMGAGGNAIAVAASQAIAATQQLSGRRSSSLKASFEAINLGVQANEFSIGRELAGAAQVALASTSFDSQHKKSKSKKSSSAASTSHEMVNSPGGGYLDVLGSQDSSNNSYGAGTDQDWSFDPNEPRYCVCNQVSYGDMVACDNDVCYSIFFLLQDVKFVAKAILAST